MPLPAEDEDNGCLDLITDEEIIEAKMALLADLDPMHKMRWMLDQISQGETMPEYCGLPMPVKGERLVLEPRHPAASVYQEQADRDYAELFPEEQIPADFEVLNSWHNQKHGIKVLIYQANGKRTWGMIAAVHHFMFDIQTMGLSCIWSIEAEAKAQQLLATLLPHHIFKMYLLTGMFLETSERSGVTYVFRRLRPSVAMKADKHGQMKILAALCMHPIGYYQGTWAGAMCPTDDVLSHLLLMRSDEPMFWRRSNQWPASSPLAGL